MLLTAMVLAHAVGHSSLLRPPSRNSVDASLPGWRRDPFYSPAGDGWGCDCGNGTTPCHPGQACFWGSQGTTIGCAAPDGAVSNPNTRDRCPGRSVAATITDPAWRTYNRGAVAGSAADVTRFNPWRYPGAAPVYHACGMAGLGPANVDRGAHGQAEYVYQTTIRPQLDHNRLHIQSDYEQTTL